jgi:hypothetical protein
MSTEDEARALMNRHQHTIKNHQQNLLVRSAEEEGLDSVSEDEARALMNRHQHTIKNHQQNLLVRSAEEIGLDSAQVHIHHQ